LLHDLAGLDAHRLGEIGDGDDLRDAHHPLRRARERDLGLLELFARECTPLLWPLAAAPEVALRDAEHIGLLDDLAAFLLSRRVPARVARSGRWTLWRRLGPPSLRRGWRRGLTEVDTPEDLGPAHFGRLCRGERRGGGHCRYDLRRGGRRCRGLGR